MNNIQGNTKSPTCGIIMPISLIEGCSESHWSDVYSIVSDAVTDAGFDANMVSSSDEVSVIQKRIIQNLYDNPIVVCDVSCRNPNVMFELGIRLAFDKPTIIVKDDKTPFSFDTSAIEHLEYPRDLRFSRIVEFKEKLSDKIKATSAAAADANYSTFLKNFGEFTVAKLDKKEVSTQQFLIDEMKIIRDAINRLEFNSKRESLTTRAPPMLFGLKGKSADEAHAIQSQIEELSGVSKVTLSVSEDGIPRLIVRPIVGLEDQQRERIRSMVNSVLRSYNRSSVDIFDPKTRI